MNSRIYLDYCATTPILSSVRNAMLCALDVDFGNPSSMHWAGNAARELISQARVDVADEIGCLPDEIIIYQRRNRIRQPCSFRDTAAIFAWTGSSNHILD
jgi:selenocysteine lyase/cysteine desulfurase